MGASTNNSGTGGGRFADVGPLLKGGGPGRLGPWFIVVGRKIPHSQDAGRLSPQGGPPTDVEESS